MADPAHDFSAALRALRRERGLSQESLARRAGLHPTEISRLERGVRQPRLQTIVQVAEALEVPVWKLLSGPADGPGG